MPRGWWFLCSSLSCLGVLVLCDRVGPVSTPLAASLAVCALGVPWTLYLLKIPRAEGSPRQHVIWLTLGWLVLLAGIRLPVWWRSLGPALSLLCWAAASGDRPTRRAVEPLAAGFALFAIVAPWLDAFPAVLIVEESWSAALTGFATALSGRPGSAGASALGFDALLLFACVVVAQGMLTAGGIRSRASRIGGSLLAAHAIPLAVAVLLVWLPGFESPLQLDPKPASDPVVVAWSTLVHHLPVWSGLIAGVLVAILLAFTLPRIAADSGEEGGAPAGRALARQLAVAGAVVALVFAGAAATWLEPARTARGAKVVLYKKGFCNWLRPSFDYYGRMSAGMFGMLPPFLESIGLHPVLTDTLDETTLRGARVLFVANPEELPTPERMELVWRFVRRGGHLLLLGDHTWLRGPGGSPLNQLLEPSQIRYRIDSANFFAGGWAYSYRPALNPLFADLRPGDNTPSMVVGASLEIGPDARALLVGRSGYSDAPALSDSGGGFLGNLAYDPGERVGDLVLVATQRMRFGRVTVFGDTSPFFNGIMCWSYSRVARVFLWAAAATPEPPFRLFLLDSILALIAGLLLAARARRTLAVLLIGATLAALAGLVGLRRELRWPAPFTAGKVAFLDNSHNPTYAAGDWDDDRIQGLMNNLMRYGYQAYYLDDLRDPSLDRASVLVEVAPRMRIRPEEAHRLLAWVARGGHLMLAVGAEEAPMSQALLDSLGVTIEPIPLGNAEADSTWGNVHTGEAWPVTVRPLAAGGPPEVLLRISDYPVAVRIARGAGRVSVIGDSQFWCNYNLEHEDHGHISNIRFVGKLLGMPPQPDAMP